MHIAGKNRFQFEMSCMEDLITSENSVRVIEAFVDVFNLERLGFVSVVPEFIADESKNPSAPIVKKADEEEQVNGLIDPAECGINKLVVSSFKFH